VIPHRQLLGVEAKGGGQGDEVLRFDVKGVVAFYVLDYPPVFENMSRREAFTYVVSFVAFQERSDSRKAEVKQLVGETSKLVHNLYLLFIGYGSACSTGPRLFV
jgi:hypothetical protein